MEKAYLKEKNACRLIKAKPETINFLLSYSKSLHVANVKGIQFEGNLN